MIVIREQLAADAQAVAGVNLAAFPTPAEANLVKDLDEADGVSLSLVALDADRVIGHILFSPIQFAGEGGPQAVGLAPMAVLPDWQGSGVGTALVERGLVECRQLGFDWVVVLGHPHYYPRFGFRPAADYGLSCRWPVPDGVFMAMPLGEVEKPPAGEVAYHDLFNQL